MEVYLVYDNSHGEYEDYEENVVGVFFTKEKALECKQQCERDFLNWFMSKGKNPKRDYRECACLMKKTPLRIDTWTVE